MSSSSTYGARADGDELQNSRKLELRLTRGITRDEGKRRPQRESGGVGNEGKSRRESEHGIQRCVAATECAIGYHVGEHPVRLLLIFTHATYHSDATLGR